MGEVERGEEGDWRQYAMGVIVCGCLTLFVIQYVALVGGLSLLEFSLCFAKCKDSVTESQKMRPAGCFWCAAEVDG